MVAVATLLFTAGAVSAQNIPPAALGAELTLQPLDKTHFQNWKLCGKYFAESAQDPNTKNSTVVFSSIRPESRVTVLAVIGRDKFIVVIDKAITSPTVIFKAPLGATDNALFHVVVRMSEKDANVAMPCLSPVGGKNSNV